METIQSACGWAGLVALSEAGGHELDSWFNLLADCEILCQLSPISQRGVPGERIVHLLSGRCIGFCGPLHRFKTQGQAKKATSASRAQVLTATRTHCKLSRGSTFPKQHSSDRTFAFLRHYCGAVRTNLVTSSTILKPSNHHELHTECLNDPLRWMPCFVDLPNSCRNWLHTTTTTAARHHHESLQR